MPCSTGAIRILWDSLSLADHMRLCELETAPLARLLNEERGSLLRENFGVKSVLKAGEPRRATSLSNVHRNEKHPCIMRRRVLRITKQTAAFVDRTFDPRSRAVFGCGLCRYNHSSLAIVRFHERDQHPREYLVEPGEEAQEVPNPRRATFRTLCKRWCFWLIYRASTWL